MVCVLVHISSKCQEWLLAVHNLPKSVTKLKEISVAARNIRFWFLLTNVCGYAMNVTKYSQCSLSEIISFRSTDEVNCFILSVNLLKCIVSQVARFLLQPRQKLL